MKIQQNLSLFVNFCENLLIPSEVATPNKTRQFPAPNYKKIGNCKLHSPSLTHKTHEKTKTKQKNLKKEISEIKSYFPANPMNINQCRLCGGQEALIFHSLYETEHILDEVLSVKEIISFCLQLQVSFSFT